MLCFTSYVQRGEGYRDALDVRHARQNEVVFPFAANQIGGGGASVSKNRPVTAAPSCSVTHSVTKNVTSFSVAASFKTRRSRSDTVL